MDKQNCCLQKKHFNWKTLIDSGHEGCRGVCSGVCGEGDRWICKRVRTQLYKEISKIKDKHSSIFPPINWWNFFVTFCGDILRTKDYENSTITHTILGPFRIKFFIED